MNGLRIRSVETFYLRAPVPAAFGWSQAWIDVRTAALVRITAEDGTQGWGEASVMATPSVISVIDELLAPRLIGRDVFDRQTILDELSSTFKAAGQRGLVIQALSGIDIAIWDVVGRALGLPVHRLLGGAANREVPAYATGLYYSSGDLETLLGVRLKEAEGYLERGFQGMKMKIGALPEHDDLEQVKSIRTAIGPDVCLMVDANQAYDRLAARRVADALASVDVLWFEEPIRNEDLQGLRHLRNCVRVPIAGGELDSTRFDFRDILVAGALDIIQPDLCMVGGFSEAQRIWHLAESFHVNCYPHVWGSAIGLAAAVQFVATLPAANTMQGTNPIVRGPTLEFDQTPNPLRDELLLHPFVVDHGAVAVPETAGLGVEIDPMAIEKFRVRS